MNNNEQAHTVDEVLEGITPSLGQEELRNAYTSLQSAILKIGQHAAEERRMQVELKERAETAEQEVASLASRIEELERQVADSKRIEEARQEGRAARQQGKPRGTNPYNEETSAELHSAWVAGWTEQDALEQLKRERNLATARVAAVQEILDDQILSYLLAWLGLSSEVIYLDDEKLDELREWATKLDMIIKTDSGHNS